MNHTDDYEFRTTHWKQDLLMLDEPVAVCTEDRITGSVQMNRNPKWRRHMTITLDFSITAKDMEDQVREFHCSEQQLLLVDQRVWDAHHLLVFFSELVVSGIQKNEGLLELFSQLLNFQFSYFWDKNYAILSLFWMKIRTLVICWSHLSKLIKSTRLKTSHNFIPPTHNTNNKENIIQGGHIPALIKFPVFPEFSHC